MPAKRRDYNPQEVSEIGNMGIIAYQLKDMSGKMQDIIASSNRLEEKLDKRMITMEQRLAELDDRYLKRTDFEPYRSNILKIGMAIILAVVAGAMAFLLKK